MSDWCPEAQHINQKPSFEMKGLLEWQLDDSSSSFAHNKHRQCKGHAKRKRDEEGKKQNKREWQWSTEEYVNSHCKQKHGALNQEWKSRAWAVCEITVIADINNQASTAKAMRSDDRCLRKIRTRVMQHKIIMPTKVLKWNTWGGFWLLKPHSSPCRPEQYAPVPDDATDMSACVCLVLVFVLCEK